MVDVEVEESGAIRMTFGRATDLSGRGESEVIFDVLAVANALRLVHWARVLSEKTDYRGAWAFGLAATNLHGLKSYQAFAEWGFDLDYDFYDRESYEATTAAHVSELENSPGAVADRLVGGLLRGLGTESKYSEHLGGRSA
jgi:hypothetical protein